MSAYQEGWFAFKKGALREDDCPFEKNTYSRREWLRGWDDALKHLGKPNRINRTKRP